MLGQLTLTPIDRPNRADIMTSIDRVVCTLYQLRPSEALATLNIMATVFWEVQYLKHVTTLREKPAASIITIPALHYQSYCRSHSPFQSDFSSSCDLVSPLSVSSNLIIPHDHSIAAYVLKLVILPLFYCV